MIISLPCDKINLIFGKGAGLAAITLIGVVVMLTVLIVKLSRKLAPGNRYE